MTEGYKAQLSDGPRRSLPGRTFINGRYIGVAPLSDGFPAGDYEVRIEYQGSSVYRQVQRLEPGRTQRVVARVALALTAEERALLQDRAASADQAAAEARTAWQHAEHEAALAQWRTAHAAWTRDTAALRARRHALGTWGGLTLGLGSALGISAGVLFGTAAAEDSEAEALSRAWDLEPEVYARDALTDRIAAHQDKRDRMQTAAIALAGSAGAAVTTGIVLLLLRPSVQAAPERPTLNSARLGLAPYAGKRAAGVQLDPAF